MKKSVRNNFKLHRERANKQKIKIKNRSRWRWWQNCRQKEETMNWKKKFIGTSAAANDQSRSSRDKIIKQKNRPNQQINQQSRPRGCWELKNNNSKSNLKTKFKKQDATL